MPIKILMPALSPTMTAGNLAKWLKQEGDRVVAGEVILEIETDKATMEVEAVDEGIIGKIMVAAGTENVPVNTVIALLLDEDEDVSTTYLAAEVKDLEVKGTDNLLHEQVPQSKPQNEGVSATYLAAEVKSIEANITDDLLDKATTLQTTTLDFAKSQPLQGQHDRIIASPLARKMAAIEGIDLKEIRGSGPHGRIIKADLLNVARDSSNSKLTRQFPEYQEVASSNMRKIIANRLLSAKQTIPHFYLAVECNMDKLLTIRADINQSTAKDQGHKVSINDFVILAAAKALRDVPKINASWSAENIRYYNNVDIAVAVAIDSGLVTPIIKCADQMSIIQISQKMQELIKKAKTNKLTPEEFQGGGFTISNLGMYKIKTFQAIINPPQSGILAVGASSQRATVVDNQIKIASIIDVSLSCDHRVVDGSVGASFLVAFKQYLEKPALMLI